jgi:hypothetical protein
MLIAYAPQSYVTRTLSVLSCLQKAELFILNKKKKRTVQEKLKDVQRLKLKCQQQNSSYGRADEHKWREYWYSRFGKRSITK